MIMYVSLLVTCDNVGTFKLELSVHPLMHFVGKDMDWAKMLAEDKNIDIIVGNSTAAANILGDSGPESSKTNLH